MNEKEFALDVFHAGSGNMKLTLEMQVSKYWNFPILLNNVCNFFVTKQSTLSGPTYKHHSQLQYVIQRPFVNSRSENT